VAVLCAGIVGKKQHNADEVAKAVTDEFDEWLKDINASVPFVRDHHGAAVIEAYFKGSPPYKKAKDREGFPDAFIVESLRDVALAHGDLSLISHDKKMRESFAGNPKVTCYATLKEFLGSPVGQDLIQESNARINFERLVPLLAANSGRLEKFLATKVTGALLGVVSWSKVENEEANLEWDLEPEPGETQFDYDGAQYYGNGVFALPFEINTSGTLSYPLSKSDYYAMHDDETKFISVTDLNDHYFEAEESEVPINVEGLLVVTLDKQKLAVEDLDESELVALLEASNMFIDTVIRAWVSED